MALKLSIGPSCMDERLGWGPWGEERSAAQSPAARQTSAGTHTDRDAIELSPA